MFPIVRVHTNPISGIQVCNTMTVYKALQLLRQCNNTRYYNNS